MMHIPARRFSILVLCFAFSLVATTARAQTITTGSLSGTVEDQQGGRLPGATIVALHTATGTKYETVVQSDGRFSILAVRVGIYQVRATLNGFKDATQGNLVV